MVRSRRTMCPATAVADPTTTAGREEGLTLTSVVAAPSHIVLDTPTDKGKKTQERETDSGLIQSIMQLS